MIRAMAERVTDKQSPEYQDFMDSAAQKLTRAAPDVRKNTLNAIDGEFEAYRKEELIFLSTHPDPKNPDTNKTFMHIRQLRDKAVDQHIEKAVGKQKMVDVLRERMSQKALDRHDRER